MTTPIPTTLVSITEYLTALSRADIQSFTRSYLPKEAIENLPADKLVGIVFPSADTTSLANRGSAKVDQIINICFKARVPKETELATLDKFVTTVSDIRDELAKSLIEGTGLLPDGMSLMTITIEPIYDFEKLADKSEFLSIIMLRTRCYRDAFGSEVNQDSCS